MRIACTGTTGLVGHAVAELLRARGHRICAVGRSPECAVPFDLALDDALPAGALFGCEALIHAAGVTDEDFQDREAAFTKAFHGAQALLVAAREAGIDQLVYFSSAHVYGPLEGLIDESRVPNPLSDYAIAHFVTEQLFRRAALEPGVATLIVRPCAVFGLPPSLERFVRWSLIPFDFPRQALGGRIVLKSRGDQRRNFVSAEGLGFLVGWWLGQDAQGTTLANAPGPDELPVYEFAALCARIAREETGRDVAVERPGPRGMEPAALEFRTRVGGHLPGTTLEDHVRGLIRALARKERS